MPIDNFWGVLVTMLVGGAVVWDVQREPLRLVRGRNIVLLAIGVWYLFQAVTLEEGRAGVDQESFDFAIFCVAVAAAMFLLGYHALPRGGLFLGASRRVALLDNPELLWRLVLFCSIFGFAPIVYNTGFEVIELFQGITGMRRTWGGLLGRGRYGGVREAFLQLEYFLRGASALGFILLLRRDTPLPRRLLCAGIVGWVLLRAFGGGARSNVVSSCLPLLAVVYFRAPVRWKRICLAVALGSVSFIYTFMAATVGSRASGEFRWESARETEYVGNEMFQELAFIAKQVPSRRDYLLGQSYYVQIVNPIPRFLWPGKPREDTGLVMAELRGAIDSRGEATMTISPGIIGEMYFNFGLWGIVVMSLVGGWLVRCWDGIREQFSRSLAVGVFYSMGLATLFLMGLSITMGMFYGLLFFYVALVVVTKFLTPGSDARPRHMENPPRLAGAPGR